MSTSTIPKFDKGFFAVEMFESSVYETILSIAVLISIPMIGWLADARLGNYAVFKVWSILLFLTVTLGEIGQTIINEYQTSIPQGVSTTYDTAHTIMGIVGIAVCLLTALQLGLDQMPDASGDNITSFISWFVFSMCAALWLFDTLPKTLDVCASFCDSSRVEIAISFIPPICMTVTCCTVFLLAPRYLVIEPKAPQALKTIYQVLKFAAKHKSPLNRSAFTYWEEDIPSRLDLGKSKYGGPFTTEQVENVKTFFKLLTVLIPISLISTAIPTNYKMAYLPLSGYSECLTISLQAVTSNWWWSGMVTIVVYELILFPLLRNKLPSILKRIGIFSFPILLIKCLYLSETIAGELSTANHTGTVVTKIDEIEGLGNVALGFLYAATITLSFAGVIEFVCAQSPYNMRGLLTGCTVFVILSALSFGNELLLQFFAKAPNYIKPHVFSQSLSIAIGLLGFVLYCVLARWYKMRVRDEDYSPHRVIEEVYDRYLSNH